MCSSLPTKNCCNTEFMASAPSGTSAEGDPQSNGAAESSVNVVKGHVRWIKLAVESASSVEVPGAICSQYAPSVCGRSRRQDIIQTKCGKGALLSPWHSLVSECGGCHCSHPTAVLWIHDLNKEGKWDRWMDRTQCLLAPQVEW